MRAQQLQLGVPGRCRFAVEVANSEDLDALTFLGLHDDDGRLLLTLLDQIGVLRNDDIERLAERNAVRPQGENGIALGDIFVRCGAARNKSGRRQWRPAWTRALARSRCGALRQSLRKTL